MRSKRERESVHHEVIQLVRFASERLARSLYIKANGSTIRILARKIEAAALRTACEETDVKPKD